MTRKQIETIHQQMINSTIKIVTDEIDCKNFLKKLVEEGLGDFILPEPIQLHCITDNKIVKVCKNEFDCVYFEDEEGCDIYTIELSSAKLFQLTYEIAEQMLNTENQI